MRYYLFILTALLTFTCACAEHEELPAPGSEERMRLTLLLRGEAPTRTGEDEALHDVNITSLTGVACVPATSTPRAQPWESNC